MRVAALYDVHGNLPALEAVLAELDQERPHAIVFGGDLVSGPMPRETLECVRALGHRAHLIRGNADRIAIESRSGQREDGDAWVGQQLTEEEADFLGALPLTITLDVDGLGPTCFCHATPRDDEEIFTERDPDEVVAGMLADTEQATVVCGHTHMQVDRRLDRWRVVNAGSVGLPHGAPGAHWAMLGPDVELRQTDYDREEATRRFRQTGWSRQGEPGRMIEHLLQPPPRGAVLDVFEEMAAEQRGS